ncbi:MAG TPA: UDP-N-acetylmuramoyl-L-alanine--D-glutamate ligase [Gammaproteobacteria bacterium]|nr:UDP-N-acetylmuramoyl-L-alanine--D-glutamate ligase [Gammaproteobacteria bacterium]
MQAAVGGHTLIVGLGATGVSVARYLAARGDQIRVIDSRAAPPGLAELRSACPGVEVALETLDARWLEGVSCVLLSPGLGGDIPLAMEARRRGIEVLGDVELFARAATAPVIAVTGTNGKSTVTTLTAKILEAQGLHAPAGGNLGSPALDLLAPQTDAYVLEVSSFQMETTESLRPFVAAVLNVSADHLDRHHTFDRYVELKAKLLFAADRAVFNADDSVVAALATRHPHATPFSIEKVLRRGYSIAERRGERWLACNGELLMRRDELALRGTHNEANALAALALTAEFGNDVGPALEVLRTFAGLPHRCQLVAERRGVIYIDDSKGTNVGATLAALRGFAGPFVLIAGGLGKGQDMTPLAAGARGKLRAAVLMGESADEIGKVLGPLCPTVRAASMGAAVSEAATLARSGDTVLLSPACASQDMFRDYRQRGELFAHAVLELAP